MQATGAFSLEKASLWKTLWTGWLPRVHCLRPCTTEVGERGRKNGAHTREKVGEPFPCMSLAFSRMPVCSFPLPVKTPYVYFLYLSKVTIILPVFLLVCPFFGNLVIFFISYFHFAQKTLSRKSLGTHSSLEESFTGLIDWKAAKLDSGQNCNELNWIILLIELPFHFLGQLLSHVLRYLYLFSLWIKSSSVTIQMKATEQQFPVVVSEMPTSGDLKSGDCLFFTTPPPPEFQQPPAPEKLTQPPMGMT